MDIVGLGTAIVECLRIGRMIEQHGELFLARAFTAREVRECSGRRKVTEAFAARWAAKEAISRSLGPAWHKGLSWTDLEVHHDEDGRPQVVLSGAARELAERGSIREVRVSMDACRAYATATALALRG